MYKAFKPVIPQHGQMFLQDILFSSTFLPGRPRSNHSLPKTISKQKQLMPPRRRGTALASLDSLHHPPFPILVLRHAPLARPRRRYVVAVQGDALQKSQIPHVGQTSRKFIPVDPHPFQILQPAEMAGEGFHSVQFVE